MSRILDILAATLVICFTVGLDALPFHSLIKSKQHQVGLSSTDPQFTEKYFTQILDHFNFNSMGNGSFQQRYLITDKYWKTGYGPIFFYTGNEGDIWEFALNSGFIIELAAQQGALVIFAEHRYYGKSLPFGEDSFHIPEVGLLTVEQALADYAVMITELKQELVASDCPVIVFGGSYGGMLSVYMRLKYPNIVAGALAASAPILSTAGLGDPRQFFRDVTADFQNISPECSDAVRGAFGQLKELAERQDYSLIKEKFALCKAPSSPQDVHQLNGLLRNAFTLMAMLDYPYSTHFMGDMPANPVKVGCDTMLSGPDLLTNLRNTAGIVYNSTGELTCFNLYKLFVECADPLAVAWASTVWPGTIRLVLRSTSVLRATTSQTCSPRCFSLRRTGRATAPSAGGWSHAQTGSKYTSGEMIYSRPVTSFSLMEIWTHGQMEG
ncbi:hypothetical protein NQD34_007220 [Periophthalmus magnuspinnatus]|nr:hypothetical protein NQD34_007220 [Periophthalmus magnuspinnatus]